jgi:hypothetical protein
MRNWRTKREALDLEAELRANRPEPSREFVHRLEARVREGRRSRAGSFRVAFAGALATGVLAALASVGGLGYASTATNSAVIKAKKVVKKHGVLVVHKSPARDQYGPKAKKKKKKAKKAKKRAAGRRFARPPFTG